jgi:hypothetical protein
MFAAALPFAAADSAYFQREVLPHVPGPSILALLEEVTA